MRPSSRGLPTASKRVLTVVVSLSAVLALAAHALGCGDPFAGASGAGDPYLPFAGNGGYDVSNYAIDLTVDPEADTLNGTAQLEARCTQDLSSFHLDLSGLQVKTVTLDGAVAAFRRKGSELTVICPGLLRSGQEFKVQVAYSGKPEPEQDGTLSVGWQSQNGYIFTLDEPTGADSWLPSNDTPSDKATYEFRITVPKPLVAAANGVLVDTLDQGEDRTFVWDMREPMATYLAQISVGDYVVQTGTSPGGTAVRNYFAPSLANQASAAFAETGKVLDYFAGLFGPYPFEAYGVLVPSVQVGAAMENQTLSLFGEDILDKRMVDPTTGVVFLAHELAHQWYGDSVTIDRWGDIWLNEGFAEYASWLWLEHDRGPQTLEDMVSQSIAALDDERYPPLGDPGLNGMFSRNVYLRGALTLHALRLTVGDQVFFQILKDWAAKYRYANVTIDDFVALATADAPNIPAGQVAGLLTTWLFDQQLPALPQP
jgi:aminopeptidase N